MQITNDISLFYQVKIPPDKKNFLEIFFKDWADRICKNEVKYSIISELSPNVEIIQVHFLNGEDALAMKLIGVPDEFKNYLTLI